MGVEAIAPRPEARLVSPVGPGVERGHFLAVQTPRAADLNTQLLDARLVTDVGGDRLRFGFGCYHTEAAIDRALERLSATLGGAQ